ncbi:unnamed protein product [Urochloa decumbens]|uniref:F-box domain-containing protein n=1 Tax=Urochloa decumbens TaxID=240449 RepID=A0ABC9E712_9POAL
MAAGAQEDRLSDLPDGVLGHVLSFLSAKEAARAAVLSRRYRHAFASVRTLSLVQEETSSSISTGASSDDLSYECDKQEQRRNAEFVALADAAFSCRRRCGGSGADPGLRAFRVVFDAFHHSLAEHVDRWISAAARNGGAAVEEITVDARAGGERGICARERPDWYFLRRRYGDRGPKELKDESDGEDAADFRDPRTRDRAYRVPRWLFSCTSAAALRTLRLGSCFLDLPRDAAALYLPSVEMLELTCVPDSGRDIQRLVSACGRLADLTLDSCRRVRAVDVQGKRLRRLALRCCHGARLSVDASALRALEYKGPVPGEHVLSFAGGGSAPPVLSSCDIEFCGKAAAASSTETELADMARFLGQFTAARWLRLGAPSMGASIDKMSDPSSLVPLPFVRRLELKGTLSRTTGAASAIAAVTRILELTPNVEALTLLILPDVDEHPRCRDEVICDPKLGLDVPGVVPPVIPCLRDRVREMNVVHYQGRMEQRALLKVLLRAATALEELYVAFPPGKFEVQSMLMREIERWVMYRPVKVVFV